MTETQGPIAIPTPAPTEFAPAAYGTGAPPVGSLPPAYDPALVGFSKIAAERRTRQKAETPVTVDFGSTTIRIYKSMPAEWAYLAADAAGNAASAFAAIREAIVQDDRKRFDEIRKLPPDNEMGIDGNYLVDFLEQLGEFYGGVPTPAS